MFTLQLICHEMVKTCCAQYAPNTKFPYLTVRIPKIYRVPKFQNGSRDRRHASLGVNFLSVVNRLT